MPTRPPSSTTSTRFARSSSIQSIPSSVSSNSFSTSTSVTITPRTPATTPMTAKPPPSAAKRFSQTFSSRQDDGCDPQTPPARQASSRSRTTSLAGSVRVRQKTTSLISDSSPLNRVTQSSSVADSAGKSSQQSPLQSTRSPRLSSSISSVRAPSVNNNKSALQRSTGPGKNTRQQSPRQLPSLGGLPGVPWSPQGTLNRSSASLLNDSPASLGRKFHDEHVHDSPSFHISVNGDAQTSVWGGEDLSYDLVTEIDDGDIDDDVRYFIRCHSRVLICFRSNQRFKRSRLSIRKSYCIISVSSSKVITRPPRSCTRSRPSCVFCACLWRTNAPRHVMESWNATNCR